MSSLYIELFEIQESHYLLIRFAYFHFVFVIAYRFEERQELKNNYNFYRRLSLRASETGACIVLRSMPKINNAFNNYISTSRLHFFTALCLVDGLFGHLQTEKL